MTSAPCRMVRPGSATSSSRVEPVLDAETLAGRARAVRRIEREQAPLDAEARRRRAEAGVEQTQVVVQARQRADRRSRVARGRPLIDGDGRGQAVDRAHRRPRHAPEELPGVRRERLQIAALRFSADRVERQRGLPGSRHAGHDRDRSPRDLDVDGLEIVLARAPHREPGHGGHCTARTGRWPNASSAPGSDPVLFFAEIRSLSPEGPYASSLDSPPRRARRLRAGGGLGRGPRGPVPQSGTAADIVGRVKSQFAPDARIAVFSVKAELRRASIELVGDVEQPAAKEALVKALQGRRPRERGGQGRRAAGCRDGRQAAGCRDGQRRRDEDEAVACVGTGQSAHHGHGREDAEERGGLALRAVGRRSLPRVDGARPRRVDDEGAGRRLRAGRRARLSRRSQRSSGSGRLRMGRPSAISSWGTC